MSRTSTILLLLLLISGFPAWAIEVQLLSVPGEVTGSLKSTDYQYENRLVDVYEFSILEHSEVVISADSAEIDPYIYVLDLQSNDLYQNDDSNGVGASLSLLLNSGTYWIGVSSDQQLSQGGYTLQIRSVKDSTYFVVDSEYLDGLSDELLTFMQDVEGDSNTTAVLVESPTYPFELRSLLRSAWLTDGLTGAFFIGDIPAVKERNEFVNPDVMPLSDHFYRALDCPYKPGGDGIAIRQVFFSVISRCSPSIWVSRIKPTIDNEGGLDQLKGYFEKNARLRNNQEAYKREMYFQTATPRENFLNFADELVGIFSSHPLYTADSVTTSQLTDSAEQKQEFVSALSNNYEILNLNIHGSADSIQFQGLALDNYLNMNSSELSLVEINAKYVAYQSCGVGHFLNPQFFAGTTLFDSNALLVEAYPEITFIFDNAITGDFEVKYRALGYGKSLADVYVQSFSGSPPHFFGDPTIKFRSEPVMQSAPVLRFDKHVYGKPFVHDLYTGVASGSNLQTKYVEVKNEGLTELVIDAVKASFEFGATAANVMVNGMQRFGGSSGFIFMLDNEDEIEDTVNYQLKVPPGESRNIGFIFNPAAHNDSVENALYSGTFKFITNDPLVAAFVVNVTGSHSGNGTPFPLTHGRASDDAVTTSVFGGGASQDNWESITEAIDGSMPVDIGGVAVVDQEHVGKTGNIYLLLKPEGGDWYAWDTSGNLVSVGKGYILKPSTAIARHQGITLGDRHELLIFEGAVLEGEGLEGKEIELKIAYSVEGEEVIYSHDSRYVFKVAERASPN